MSYQSYLAIKQGHHHLARIHSIPCSQCTFCTGDYRLKCAVHPFSAGTEEAIGCLDFESHSPTTIPHEAKDYVSF
jgi:hypothetical protein